MVKNGEGRLKTVKDAMERSKTLWNGQGRFKTARDALGRLDLGRFGTPFLNVLQRPKASSFLGRGRTVR